MRFEDALLFVVFDMDSLENADIGELARGAIGVGADLIGLKKANAITDPSPFQNVARVCREEDALFIVWHEAALVHAIDADGVNLSGADSIGNARAVAGEGKLVGYTTTGVDDAMLAAEVGADYIVHTEGLMCPSVFSQLRGGGLANMYAAGLNSLEEARQVVGNGVFRICLEIKNENEAKAETIAEYSRLFGRVI